MYKQGVMSMGYQCGWASSTEYGNSGWNGKAKAGDQNGREVRLGNYYQFKQTVVYRFKDRNKAKKYAKFIKKACQNNYIGYDQSQRTTLYTQLTKVDFDITKVKTKCECDCSSLVAAGLLSVGINVPYNWRTATIADYIMDTGEFTKLTDKKYLKSGAYLMTGDIVNRPGHHVISVIEDGSKVKVLTTEEKFVKGLQKSLNSDYDCGLTVDYSYGPKTKKALAAHNIKKGSKYYCSRHLQYWLNRTGFTDDQGKKLEVDGDFGEKTAQALIKAQKSLGVEADAVFGTGTCEKFMKLL